MSWEWRKGRFQLDKESAGVFQDRAVIQKYGQKGHFESEAAD